jgi:hypothetical protein
MLKIDSNMVIFCDNVSLPLIMQGREGKMEKTKIEVMMLEEFYTYKYYSTFLKDYQIDREQRIGHTPPLYMIWNEKSNFLKRAIEMNPFNDEFYLWVDIGCFRYKTEDFLNYPSPSKIEQQDKSKVLLLAVVPFTQFELDNPDLNLLPDYTKNYRVSGTIFGGGKDVLLNWHTKYYNMLENFIAANRFIGKDQSIMDCTYLFNQEMCNLIQSPIVCRDQWFYLQDYLN